MIFATFVFLIAWWTISFFSAHSGIDLVWYLSTDFIADQEAVSYYILFFLRSLGDTFLQKASILCFSLGFALSFLTYSALKVNKLSNKLSYLLIPYCIFLPPIFLAAEGMYRQGIAQAFLILSFLLTNLCLKKSSFVFSVLTICIFLLGIFSHKSLLLSLPAILFAFIIVGLQSNPSSFFAKLLLAAPLRRCRPLFFLAIIAVFPLLVIGLNLYIGPIASVLFGSTTRESSSGMTYLYHIPLLLQLSFGVYFIYLSFSGRLNLNNNRFPLFLNCYLAGMCATALIFHATPEYYQRTYYMPLLFSAHQLLGPCSVVPLFLRKLLLYLFIAIPLLLILSPQYQYLTSPL